MNPADITKYADMVADLATLGGVVTSLVVDIIGAIKRGEEPDAATLAKARAFAEFQRAQLNAAIEAAQ